MKRRYFQDKLSSLFTRAGLAHISKRRAKAILRQKHGAVNTAQRAANDEQGRP